MLVALAVDNGIASRLRGDRQCVYCNCDLVMSCSQLGFNDVSIERERHTHTHTVPLVCVCVCLRIVCMRSIVCVCGIGYIFPRLRIVQSSRNVLYMYLKLVEVNEAF